MKASIKSLYTSLEKTTQKHFRTTQQRFESMWWWIKFISAKLANTIYLYERSSAFHPSVPQIHSERSISRLQYETLSDQWGNDIFRFLIKQTELKNKKYWVQTSSIRALNNYLLVWVCPALMWHVYLVNFIIPLILLSFQNTTRDVLNIWGYWLRAGGL